MRTLPTLSAVLLSLTLIFYTAISNADDGESSRKWIGKGYDINGGWNISEQDGKQILTFDEDFSTRKGPDLKIYLSRESIQKVKGRSVTKSSVLISPLKSEKGAQQYELPSDLNLDDFSSVLIHCEAYAHLWGGGSLKDGE